jgi:hypothetical protein
MSMVHSTARTPVRAFAAVGATVIAGVGIWAVTAPPAHQSSAVGRAPTTGTPQAGLSAPTRGGTTAGATPRPGAATAAKGAGAAHPAAVRPAASTPPLTGTFTLWLASPQADPCRQQQAAPDIHAGASVLLRTLRGEQLARTILTSGRSEATHRGCVYRFAVTPLTSTSPFTVTVGTRTGLSFRPADLMATGGRLTLNFGVAS